MYAVFFPDCEPLRRPMAPIIWPPRELVAVQPIFTRSDNDTFTLLPQAAGAKTVAPGSFRLLNERGETETPLAGRGFVA